MKLLLRLSLCLNTFLSSLLAISYLSFKSQPKGHFLMPLTPLTRLVAPP